MRPSSLTNHLRSPWGQHPELTAELKTLWTETDTTASEIAALPQFRSVGINRSAIIGKAHRLGLIRGNSLKSWRPKVQREVTDEAYPHKNFHFGRRVNRSSAGERIIMVKKSAVEKQTELAMKHLETCNPVGIFDLHDRGCRFVVDGDRDTTLFCNTVVPDHTGPIGHWCYCEYHHGRMFRGGGVE